MFPVFNIKIVHALIQDGYEVRKVEQNHKYPERLVYYFDDSPEVRAYLPGERTDIIEPPIPVFSYPIAYQIIKDGYEPVKVEINRRYPSERLVFWFEPASEIRHYLPHTDG